MSITEDMSSDEIFNQGKRFYYVEDYSKALEYLSKACKLIATEKGDTCDEMFNPYVFYAKSLYMYFKSKSDLIGERMNNVDKIEEVDENDDISDGEGSKVTEINSDDQTGDGLVLPKSHDGDDLTVPKSQDGGLEESKIQDGGLEKSNIQDGGESASNDNEEVGYLQMAYETIECAKLIIAKQLKAGIIDELDLQLKLADCCDVAGDIYVEEEVLKEAIEQYETALASRIKYLLPWDRAIAESYYKIAVAYNINYELLMARDNFIKCRDVLLLTRDEFVKKGESTDELDGIISDVDERVIEAELSEAEYLKSKAELAKQVVKPMLDAPTSDITHLVRKKPNNNDDDAPPSKVAKKDF